MQTAFYASTSTTDGPFTVVVSDNTVLASGWTDTVEELLPKIHPTLAPNTVEFSAEATATAIDAVNAYYAGDFAAVEAVAVRQTSGPFREHAWTVLRSIPVGQCVTYSDFAALCGKPAAVRAAASACATNAAALFVPCHRVLSKDGSLGGFYYGTAIKQHLLELEEG